MIGSSPFGSLEKTIERGTILIPVIITALSALIVGGVNFGYEELRHHVNKRRHDNAKPSHDSKDTK